MSLSPFRFKLRRLIGLVAAWAVFFGLLRTLDWPWIMPIGLVLCGFIIDWAKGGAGILGGAISLGLLLPYWWVAGVIYDLFFAKALIENPVTFLV